MAAYRRVYDLRHLQADCQELGSAPKPYAQWLSMGYLYLFYINIHDDLTWYKNIFKAQHKKNWRINKRPGYRMS